VKLALSTVVVDLASGEVLGGAHGDLTDTERRLLAHLVRHRGTAVSRDELLTEVWRARPGLKTRMVDRAVARLRRKLGDDGAPKHLLSVYGEGYRWVHDLDPEAAAGPPHEGVTVQGWALPTPTGPCVGRSDALAQLQTWALTRPHLRVGGPVGVGRYRVLCELAWRLRARFPGGVHAVAEVAELPRWAAAARSDRAALVVLRDPDPDLVWPTVDGLCIWGTVTGRADLQLAPLSDDDATVLLQALRQAALPTEPLRDGDPVLRALVRAGQGLPAVLVAAEGLARTLPVDDVLRHLAHDEPVDALLRDVLGSLPAEVARAAHRLARTPDGLHADDLPHDEPLRRAARQLVASGLMPAAPHWRLPPAVAGGLRRLDPAPERTAREVVDLLVEALRSAEGRMHCGDDPPERFARLARALLSATDEVVDDRHALAIESACVVLGRAAEGAALLVDAELGPDGRQARGRIRVGLGQHSEALDDLDGPPQRCDSGAARARALTMMGELEAATHAWRASEAAPGEPWHRDEWVRVGATLAAYAGDWRTAMAHLHDALVDCRERGDRSSEARLLATLGHTQAAAGDPTNARVNLAAAAELLWRYGDRRGARLALLVQGQLDLAADDVPSARRAFERTLRDALADRHDDMVRMAGTLAALGALVADDPVAAEASMRHVAVDTPLTEHAFRRVELAVRAWLLALGGHSDQAACTLARALTGQPRRPNAPARGLAHLLLSSANHPAASDALRQTRDDVRSGDEEHAGLVEVLESRRGDGVYATLATRWRWRSERKGWRPSDWSAQILADAIVG
jgi:DNA-binding winged helix-turn-helix (wHTH) protein/tetratricopeptide (TPR) repeat protein